MEFRQAQASSGKLKQAQGFGGDTGPHGLRKGCRNVVRILVGTIGVATLTHFPRILPPIMKCVALAEAPFCSKKVYSWSLPAAGPSSNVSYITASART